MDGEADQLPMRAEPAHDLSSPTAHLEAFRQCHEQGERRRKVEVCTSRGLRVMAALGPLESLIEQLEAPAVAHVNLARAQGVQQL